MNKQVTPWQERFTGGMAVAFNDQVKAMQAEIDELRAALAAQPEQVGAMFYYRPTCNGEMYEGPYHANSTQVRMFPEEKRHELIPLYAHPPAQPARKPLTDDPLQGAVDWLLKADGDFFCVATVQRTLRIGYNRAKRLADVAKDRAHGIGTPPREGL